jgi:glutathione synthase/RimK-type ligase-like ATP-grasp enzyme
MHLLFVADPLESFKIYKDTTFAMMREAQRCGHRLSVCEPKDIRWQRGECVIAFVRDITLTGTSPDWFVAEQQALSERPQALKDFDAVVMRKDPPFDSEFFTPPTCWSRLSAKVPRCSTNRERCVITPKSWPYWSGLSTLARRW